MTHHPLTRAGTRAGLLAGVACATLLHPAMARAADDVTLAPRSSDAVAALARDPALATALGHDAKRDLLRQKIRYVFVLFQENRSFDVHFGTYPGADGLFSRPAAQTPGFTQPIVGTDGARGTISPFLMPRSIADATGKAVALYPEDTDSVDHSHTGIDNSLDVDANRMAHNDRYALNEEGLTTAPDGGVVALATRQPATAPPTLKQKQRAELVMGHLDCDTVPFLWQYADRFTLFDQFHQTVIGPSTPNAIAMIAGQSGETQWALHPETASGNKANPDVARGGGEPVMGDPGPYPGSGLDTAAIRPAFNAGDENPAKPTLTQTYASLPLSFMGREIEHMVAADQNPAMDLLDVRGDIGRIAGDNLDPVAWAWYQQGYDHEATDTGSLASHSGYIVHHNGPQYFGYVGDNPAVAAHLRGLGDFFADLAHQSLEGDTGGVFYVRGGYGNIDGMKPLDPSPAAQKNFPGNDDHPGYSDAQISEALLAREVDAIAASPYWPESAIIIAYDETDGLYDHALPHIRSMDPQGNPLAGGPRIPAIVISPFAYAHAVSHAYAEHSSVINFINELHGLTPLSALPDEARGRELGKTQLGQPNLGPADGQAAPMDDMFSAFDPDRLSGRAPPLPASLAMIDPVEWASLPHYGGQGCHRLGITPTDYVDGKLIDPAPSDFNPRPGTAPGLPASGNWTP